MTQFLLVLSLLSLAACWTTDVQAQQTRGRRTYSPGPTLTPYLDYFRRPTGILDRYNQFVIPRRQLTDTLQQQQSQIQQQDVGLQQVRTEIGQVEGRLQQIRQPAVRPTGNPASFMNFSHYFGGR